ncbi:MAG: hypothetical protein Q9217_004356 [Psora testacea]
MLHELLLSLSGHPSPFLLSDTGSTKEDFIPFRSLLSPAEHALVKSLSEELGSKHRSVRNVATKTASSHPSTVCRAVSAAIISTHLAKFQRRILEVEKDILEENPSVVGAYNVVPLSAIAGAFDGWGRRLAWLWDLVLFIYESGTIENERLGHDALSPRTAAELIQWLRDASHTGYPDIEHLSLDLIKVAEIAWLKQVSAWVLYGQHPGASDFFVSREYDESSAKDPTSLYRITPNLVPCFVTHSTANSILFIGQSLNHIKERQSSKTQDPCKMTAPELALLPTHLAQLSALRPPISSASFSAAISAIRLSLSQNALQKLLPMSNVLEILQVLKDFFLLGRGEFAIALITAAEGRVSSPYQHTVAGLKAGSKRMDDLAGLTIRDGEVHRVLARTWTTLASLHGAEDDENNEGLDRARELITLSIKSLETGATRPQDGSNERAPTTVSFDDVLLPSSTFLDLRVPSPLDLFLTPADIETYSILHAYLLAIRRAHWRLTKLFLLSALRRNHLSPTATTHLSRAAAFDALASKRQRINLRARTMRPIWATIGSAAFFLAELGEYLQGQVVQSSWNMFREWLVPPISPTTLPKGSNILSSSLRANSSHLSSAPPSSRRSDDATTYGIRDPESLREAHRSYLVSLRHSVLLDDPDFTTLLRRQMTVIDHMSALMQRLNIIQQSLEAELDASEDSTSSQIEKEERRLIADLHSSHTAIASGVQSLIGSLRNIDNARARGRDPSPLQTPGRSENNFIPWSGSGLDRLLLKFDYRNVDTLVPPQFING